MKVHFTLEAVGNEGGLLYYNLAPQGKPGALYKEMRLISSFLKSGIYRPVVQKNAGLLSSLW